MYWNGQQQLNSISFLKIVIKNKHSSPNSLTPLKSDIKSIDDWLTITNPKQNSPSKKEDSKKAFFNVNLNEQNDGI